MKGILGICAFLAAGVITQAPVTAQESSAQRTMRGMENSPFIGTWQLDAAQTKLGERTVKYESSGDSIRFTTPLGAQYTFKTDGAEYPTDSPDETVSWKRLGDRSYEVELKDNGKVVSKSQREISPDGNTLTITTTGESGGVPYTAKTIFQRESGSDGNDPLLGAWKQSRDNSNLPATLTYAPAANGLQVTYQGPNMPGDSYTLVFDGQDHQPAAEYRSGLTVAATQVDDHTIQEHWKQQGKPFSTSTIQVSSDGQRLTETQKPANSAVEGSVFVYQRRM